MPNLVQIGQLVRPGRVLKESKKRKKGKERNLQWQTGCSPRPPTLTQRHVVLHAGWSSGDSSKFQVSSKSVEPFSRFGGSKFAISYTLGLYNSLYYRTSRDYRSTYGTLLKHCLHSTTLADVCQLVANDRRQLRSSAVNTCSIVRTSRQAHVLAIVPLLRGRRLWNNLPVHL